MSLTPLDSIEKTGMKGTEHLDLKYYIQVIQRFKWRIISLASVITLLAAVIVFSITPQYKATATLLIQAEQANVVSIEEVYGFDSSRQDYLFTQFEILKSKEIARRVVEKLNIVDHPEFDPDKQPQQFSLMNKLKALLPFLPQQLELLSEQDKLRIRKRKVIEEFISRLTISPIRKTQLVNISFVSASPVLAADVSNLLAEVYIENHLEAKLNMTEKASSWLNERLSILKDKLERSEAQLQA